MSASVINEQTIPFARVNIDGRNKILNRALASPSHHLHEKPRYEASDGLVDEVDPTEVE